MHLLDQRHDIVLGPFNTHDGAQRSDEDFSRQKGTDNRHPIAPVQAQWLKDRFNPLPQHAQPGTAQIRALIREVAQNPDYDSHTQNDGTRLGDKVLGPLHGFSRNGYQCRDAVGRQFHHERHLSF